MEPGGTKSETKEIAAFWLLIAVGCCPIASSIEAILDTRGWMGSRGKWTRS